MSLTEVVSFKLSPAVLRKTEESLRLAGAEGYELFVLWSGVQRGDSFHVQTAHVPRQTSYRTENGLLVRVEGDALHELNVWLYKNGEQVAAQVHAHPTEAFHSDTDNTYPIAAQIGSLSLVAGDFCRHGLLHRTSAAFRLSRSGWDAVDLPIHKVLEVL